MPLRTATLNPLVSTLFPSVAAPAAAAQSIGAIRFGSSISGLTTTATPGGNLWTIGMWLRFRVTNVGSGRQMCSASQENTGGTVYQLFETTFNANTMEAHDSVAGGFLFTGTLPVNGWFYLAMSNTNGVESTLYYKTSLGASLTKVTGNNFAAFGTAAKFMLGTNDAAGQNEWWDGDICRVRSWNAELTEAELNAEANAAAPVRTSNLYAVYNLQDVASLLTDSSGNGRNLTKLNAGGSWTVQTGPALT